MIYVSTQHLHQIKKEKCNMKIVWIEIDQSVRVSRGRLLQLPPFPMIMRRHVRRTLRGRHMHTHMEPVTVRPQASAHKLPRLVWHRLPPSSTVSREH